MRCAAVLLAWFTYVGVLFAHSSPQAAPGTGATFEVASIKRNTSVGSGMRVGFEPGGRFVLVNGPVATAIRSAYESDTSELAGAPGWLESDRYDITAKAEGDPPREQMTAMLQVLLKERFKLAVHYETREGPVYALMVARSDGGLGPGLRRSELDCDAIAAARRTVPPAPYPTAANGAPACGMSVTGGTMRFGGLPIAALGRSISGLAGRVIVDKTGLTGNWEFTLRYSGRPPTGEAAPGDPPSIFTSLQEQLGLKLEPDRAPLRILVIDRIERPVED